MFPRLFCRVWGTYSRLMDRTWSWIVFWLFSITLCGVGVVACVWGLEAHGSSLFLLMAIVAAVATYFTGFCFVEDLKKLARGQKIVW